MKTLARLAATAVMFAATSLVWANPSTSDYDSARKAFVEHSECGAPRHLEAGKYHGEMASCVMGEGRTVVWEIEKSMTDDGVQRIRFTWFDFAVEDPTEAKRISPHVDQKEAERKLDAFLEVYAPCAKTQLTDGFFGTRAEQTRNRDGMTVAVRHFHNPSLVERVVEIYPSSSVD